MIYDVFQLYRAGRRVSFTDIDACAPTRGQLELMRRFPGTPSMMAVLVDDKCTDLIVPLVDAKVVRIKADALLISGLEIRYHVVKIKSHTPGYYVPQKWLCRMVVKD